MNKKILYLHVGWSKTGTSAIQSQLQQQREDLLERGILYPQSLQWPDHSHHPFALSFRNNTGAYKANMSVGEALSMLRQEYASSAANSVLISSELSPVYFNNAEFVNFVEEHFDEVHVLFTVRRQSELLMSLMNQLVKDPNVRYRGSIFQLAMQNISQLNFYQNILSWEKFVDRKNIHCFAYSSEVVKDFLGFFGIVVQDAGHDMIVNKSVPNRIIPLLQTLDESIPNPTYLEKTEEFILEAQDVHSKYSEVCLFSAGEQDSFDQYFSMINNRLSKEYLNAVFPTPKNYSDIMALKK